MTIPKFVERLSPIAAFGTVAVLIVFPIVFWPLYTGLYPDGELALKHPYSLLKTVGDNHREHTKAGNFTILPLTHFLVIGMPLQDRDEGHLWIIASGHNGEKILCYPVRERFVFTQGNLQRLASYKIQPAVAKFLELRLANEMLTCE